VISDIDSPQGTYIAKITINFTLISYLLFQFGTAQAILLLSATRSSLDRPGIHSRRRHIATLLVRTWNFPPCGRGRFEKRRFGDRRLPDARMVAARSDEGHDKQRAGIPKHCP
jgi:hypothetical protein